MKRDQETHRSAKGFTLIEMMIVVVIIAVLVAVAIVAYTRHIKSTRIVQEKVFVSKIQALQETYFQRYGVYCNVTDGSPYPGTVPQTGVTFNPGGNWGQLGARPESGTTYASWDVVASESTANHAVTTGPSWAQSKLTATTGVPWFAVQGRMDLDGNSASGYTEIYTTSQKGTIWTVGEGN